MKLNNSFFQRDVLEVAPELIGKVLVRKYTNGEITRHIITETEAYRGEEDKASHASKGRTNRTEIMYAEGGRIYIYLIYGMYWMLNFVTAGINQPQAVLIRGIEGFDGPGKLTRALEIDNSLHSANITKSENLWVEDQGNQVKIASGKRIGIDYAGEEWINKPWRFTLNDFSK